MRKKAHSLTLAEMDKAMALAVDKSITKATDHKESFKNPLEYLRNFLSK